MWGCGQLERTIVVLTADHGIPTIVEVAGDN
jgi:hypothetical protein